MSGVRETVVEIMQSPKTGVTVAGGTLSSGLAKAMEWIPDDIGKLATLVGIVLSLTLIYVHIGRMRLDRQEAERKAERDELELAILRERVVDIKKVGT